MTAREYCLSHDTIAYYSGFGGVEIKGIEYEINDYIYCVSNAWYGAPSYHCASVRYTQKGKAYFMLHGRRVPLDECIRTNLR